MSASFRPLDPDKLFARHQRLFYVKIKPGTMVSKQLVELVLSGLSNARSTIQDHRAAEDIYVVTSDIDIREKFDGCSWIEAIYEEFVRTSPRSPPGDNRNAQ